MSQLEETFEKVKKLAFSTQSRAFAYVYDEEGLIEVAVNPNGDAEFYHCDDRGNRQSIAEFPDIAKSDFSAVAFQEEEYIFEKPEIDSKEKSLYSKILDSILVESENRFIKYSPIVLAGAGTVTFIIERIF